MVDPVTQRVEISFKVTEPCNGFSPGLLTFHDPRTPDQIDVSSESLARTRTRV